MARTTPSATKTLNYALAAYLIALPAMVGLYTWAT